MGCGSSFSVSPSSKNNHNKSSKVNDASNTKSGKLPPIITEKKTSQQKSKRGENFEPFTLICLDEHFHENDKQLRSIIDYVCCFTDLKKCEEFILNIEKKSLIFFIVSNEYFTNIISHIHELPQLIAIYVLQENKTNNYRKDNIDKHWTKRYSKMKGVYSDREILLDKLTFDVRISSNLHDLTPITVYSRIDAIQTNNNNNSTDHLRFLFYQLFLQQYCLNSSSVLNKNDFLDLIRKYYSTNRDECHLIDDFEEDYNPSKNAFTWFTRDRFIRRILTQSLFTLNIERLFSLRFFLKDMFKIMTDKASMVSQKNNLYQNGTGRFANGRLTNDQIVYRGQALTKDTFDKIKSNIGEILSMNNFMFVSKDRQGCLALLRQNLPATESVSRVLFEIKIPSEYSLQKQRPFVEISSLNDSKKSYDEENDLYSILFFIGSIFRINTVTSDTNNDCSIIQLTLYDEKINQDFSQLFTFLNERTRTNKESTMTIANLLRQISPNAAEQFYQYLLKDNSDFLSKFECYRGLGLCSYSQDDHERALTYFEKALHLKPSDKVIKSSLHNSIGLVYARQDQTDQALNHFNQALENSSVPLHMACVHHNLALIYSKQGKYEEELDHYEEAFQIRTRQVPTQNLQLASLYNNIGLAYSDMHEYDQALSNLKKALEIRLKLLSDNHLDVARSYANIGTVYSKTQEFRMALDYMNKAQRLFEKQLPIPQEDMEQLEKNIKIVNDKLRRKTC